MSKAKLTKALKHLQSLNHSKFHATLWILKRTLHGGVASYTVSLVRTEPKLQRKLGDIVARAIRSANHVQEYEYLTADQDEDMALGLKVNETDMQSIQEQVASGSDNPQITEAAELFDSWAYAIELTNGKDRILGVRKIGEGWKLKQQHKILSAVFKDHTLLDYEDESIFKLDKAIDCFSYDGILFILDKRKLEAALNLRSGMENNLQGLLSEFDDLGLVTDVEVIRAKVGNRLSLLRRISMIKNSGYYRLPDFMQKVQSLCTEKGWDIKFDGKKIVVTETNVELLLKLLNNDRLESPLP